MRTALETGDYYWRDVLLVGGGSTLPTSAGRADAAGGELTYAELALESLDLPLVVARVSEASGQPAEAVVIAAHAKVLATWCGGIVVVLGLRAPDAHTVLPLRVSTAGRSWRDLLRSAGHAYTDLMQHHTYPVDLLRSDLGLYGPAFSTVLRLGPTPLEPDLGVPLCVDMDPHAPAGLRLRHRTDVLDAGDATRIGWDHVRVLRAMAAQLDAVHDLAEAPEIRLARPRSTSVSVG